jgi:hypothetical protein
MTTFAKKAEAYKDEIKDFILFNKRKSEANKYLNYYQGSINNLIAKMIK